MPEVGVLDVPLGGVLVHLHGVPEAQGQQVPLAKPHTRSTRANLYIALILKWILIAYSLFLFHILKFENSKYS